MPPSNPAVDNNLSVVNKKIYELKKKIQLSEGRRKAHFEECCAAKEKNAQHIKELNKELRQLRERLGKPPSRGDLLIQTLSKYPEDAGTLRIKKNVEAVALVDHQVFNQKKKLSRLIYEENKYQELLAKLKKQKNELLEKVSQRLMKQKDKIYEQRICSLENQFHVVEMNMMEAEHIYKKYRSIRHSLSDDAVHFETTMEKLREAAELQEKEIATLKSVHKEAVGLRDKTKGTLVRQEENAIHQGKVRDRQLAEHRGLVEERKLELERLERHIFPVGRPLVHQDSETEMDIKLNAKENSTNITIEVLEDAFSTLKEATGVTEIEEVLERFLSQNATKSRLSYLKNIAEEEKDELEKRHECMLVELEAFKFAEVKDKEQNVEENEKVKKEITEQTNQRDSYKLETEHITEKICNIRTILYSFTKKLEYMDQIPMPDEVSTDMNTIFLVLDVLKQKVKSTLGFLGEENKLGNIVVEDTELQELVVPIRVLPEDMWMFPKNLTELGGGDAAQAQQTAGTSEDEEDVPSRTYLKRQAQILVDARSRRKQFHPVPRGKKGLFCK